MGVLPASARDQMLAPAVGLMLLTFFILQQKNSKVARPVWSAAPEQNLCPRKEPAVCLSYGIGRRRQIATRVAHA
jgi:hypothetical protein